MARVKKAENVKVYTVTVKGKPDYCGVGAGGTQFAHGEAQITSERLAEWFRNHKGYEVENPSEAPAKAE